MFATGCPLGDASSFLVRVGEYARVSVVFQFIFSCMARILKILREPDLILHIWVWVVAWISRLIVLLVLFWVSVNHLPCTVLQNRTSDWCWIYMIHGCLQCFRVVFFGSSCQVPVATGREGCFRICHCDGTSRLSNCVNLDCVPRKPCILRDKTISKLKYSVRTVSSSDLNNNKVLGSVTEITSNVRNH